jgi:hypothetical protein
MISLAKVLSGKPILITQNIYFYQPTIQEITDMGDDIYWGAINLWLLKRSDLIPEETEETKSLDDYEV